MGKGGATTTTSTTTGLPDFIEPYYQDLLTRTQEASNLPYQTYGNPRLAEFSPDTLASFDMVRDNANAGAGGLTSAIQTAGDISGYQANQINSRDTSAQNVNWDESNYRPDSVIAQNVGLGDAQSGTGDFGFRGVPNADMSSYMNPYIGNVLDVQKQRLGQSFQEQQAGRDASAVAAGAYGGDRRFVSDSLAQRDMNNQLQGIEAEGLSSAFDRATDLFSSDEQRRLSAYEGDAGRKLNAATGNVNRQLQAGVGNADRNMSAYEMDAARRLQALTGNADRDLQSSTGNADRGLSASIASEEARRSGSALGLEAATRQGQMQTDLQDYRLRGAEALSEVGSKIQKRDQSGLDMAYQDFISQRDYPKDQLAFFSSILNGAPVSPTSTTTTTEPAPDWLSGLLGLGVTGAGIYDLFN